MKLFQSDIEDIQIRTHKEYEVMYSNNAESEYVVIYDDDVIEEIISDLLDYINETEHELDKKKEEIDDIIEDRKENYRRINVASQYNINENDFH